MKKQTSSGTGITALLLTLIIVSIFAEAGVLSRIGVDFYQAKEAERIRTIQYERSRQQLEALMANPPPVRYIGPEVQVVNGELVRGAWTPVTEPVRTEAPKEPVRVRQNTPAPVPKTETKKAETTPAPSGSASVSTPKVPEPAPAVSTAQTPAEPPKPAASMGTPVSVSPNGNAVPSIAPVNTSGNSSGGGASRPSGSGSWGESSTTNEITGSLDRPAYWVSGGKSYHFSKSCPSLARSTNILEGTLQDALNAGKTDPCNNCAGGS